MFYRKWKIKNTVVLDVWSATHLEAFWIKQGVLFLHISNVLGVLETCACDYTPHMPKPAFEWHNEEKGGNFGVPYIGYD